jgi:hypothetical protein
VFGIAFPSNSLSIVKADLDQYTSSLFIKGQNALNKMAIDVDTSQKINILLEISSGPNGLINNGQIEISLKVKPIISNIQNTIYHKYYEPMFLIVFFTLFKNINLGFLFKNKKFFIYLYAFYFVYIFARIIKNIYIT